MSTNPMDQSEPATDEVAPGNGPDAANEPDEEPWQRTPRLGPALAVVGLAVLIAGGGAAISLIGSGQRPIRAASLGRLHGVALAAESAAAGAGARRLRR